MVTILVGWRFRGANPLAKRPVNAAARCYSCGFVFEMHHLGTGSVVRLFDSTCATVRTVGTAEHCISGNIPDTFRREKNRLEINSDKCTLRQHRSNLKKWNSHMTCGRIYDFFFFDVRKWYNRLFRFCGACRDGTLSHLKRAQADNASLRTLSHSVCTFLFDLNPQSRQ